MYRQSSRQRVKVIRNQYTLEPARWKHCYPPKRSCVKTLNVLREETNSIYVSALWVLACCVASVSLVKTRTAVLCRVSVSPRSQGGHSSLSHVETEVFLLEKVDAHTCVKHDHRNHQRVVEIPPAVHPERSAMFSVALFLIWEQPTRGGTAVYGDLVLR